MDADADEAGDRAWGMEIGVTVGGRRGEGTILSWTASFTSLEEPFRRSSWSLSLPGAGVRFEEDRESGGSWTGYCNIRGQARCRRPG